MTITAEEVLDAAAAFEPFTPDAEWYAELDDRALPYPPPQPAEVTL